MADEEREVGCPCLSSETSHGKSHMVSLQRSPGKHSGPRELTI